MGGAVEEQMREALRSGAMVSAAACAEQFGAQPEAVAAAVAALRRTGCEIWDIPGYGWLLPGAPLPLDEAAIRRWLPADTPWRVFSHIELDSTMSEARRLAEREPGEFIAVIAERQTAGTGRLERPWHSPAGGGLWMTLLLRPTLPPERAPLFTLTAAVAVAGALRGFGFPVGIKWPNDILVVDEAHWRRKLCGIRAEMSAGPERIDWLTVGIGVNVNNQDFPPALADIAVSLRTLNNGVPLLRARIAAEILLRMERCYAQLQREGFAPVRAAWLAHAVGIGEPVTINGVNERRHGVAVGLDAQGCLLLQEADAATPQPVLAGDMVLRV